MMAINFKSSLRRFGHPKISPTPCFLQAEKLCGSVELGLGPDAPLLVKYDLESGENGHMKFYLAPKIDE